MESVKIYVGNIEEFRDNSRKLIKYDTRNIMVIYYGGKFYAMDNACYHHGGPLLDGDIEDFHGRLCIKCPWHLYKIDLNTGEGLYVSIEINSAGGKPKSSVRSKGCKQRVHKVNVDTKGKVYLIVDLSGPAVESDRYANMSIANREGASSMAVVHKKRNISSGIHSLLGPQPGQELVGETSLDSTNQAKLFPNVRLDLRKNNFDEGHFAQSQKYSYFAVDHPEDSTVSKFVVSCNRIENVCEGICEFFFRSDLETVLQTMKPGQYVELELPIESIPNVSTPCRRKWTICTVNRTSSVFSILVKANTNNPDSASMWLHKYCLYTPLKLHSIGGTCTFVDHLSQICALQGQVLWLTAGVAIVSAYAAISCAFDHTEPLIQGIRQLEIVHLHVDRCTKSIPKLNDLVQYSRRRSDKSDQIPHTKLNFRVFATQQNEPTATDNRDWDSFITYGRRMNVDDVEEAVHHAFGSAHRFLTYLCGPPQFIQTFSDGLLAMGVSQGDIITEEF